MSQLNNKNKRKRTPRTTSEVDCAYLGSRCCLRCLQNKRKCTFLKDDDDKCLECNNHGSICQPTGTSYIHSKINSTLGKRQACVTCMSRKEKCIYDEPDEWKYTDVSCLYCKKHNKCCWPLVRFSGMRSNSSKLFSGVDYAVLPSNDACEVLALAVDEAADNFLPTIDYPKNFNRIVSTQRPARCRNNYGTIKRHFDLNNTRYDEIASYGSGCGVSSVGTTQK